MRGPNTVLFKHLVESVLRIFLLCVSAVVLSGCYFSPDGDTCYSDSDCPFGKYCPFPGLNDCEAQTCVVPTDCKDEGAKCVFYLGSNFGRCSGCTSGPDCTSGTHCASNHWCQSKACSNDLECTTEGPNLVCTTGNGASSSPTPAEGMFEDGGSLNFGSTATAQAVFGDLDNDGDIDFFTAEANGPDRVFFNQGGDQGNTLGEFQDSFQTLGSGASTSVALADVDKDGDLDVAIGRTGSIGGVLLWINDGTGSFTAGQNIGTQDVQAVAFADLDGDGAPDMIQGHFGTNATDPDLPEITTWKQIGPGAYAPFSVFGAGSNFVIKAIELGDLDGDGDLDVFSASGLAPRVWMNQAGELSDVQTLDAGLGSLSEDIALADFDLDGDLDAVVANSCQPNDVGTDACSNHVWINQGGDQVGEQGVFLDSGQRLGTSKTTTVTVGSAAGQINVFFGNTAKSNEIWAVDQKGIFRDTGQVIGTNETTWDIAAVDTDGDGDNELISFNPFFGNNTYWTGGGSSDLGECVECLDDSQCGTGKTCVNEKCWTIATESLTVNQSQVLQETVYGDTNSIVFALEDHSPGADTAHTITVDVAKGDLQIYSVIINYPLAFGWKGFNALGPARTEVGRRLVDADFDGNAELEFALLSYDGSTAYGDLDGDLTPIGNSVMGYKRLSSHRFSSFWPDGGDNDAARSQSPGAYRVKLLLHAGVMSNPAVEGDYEVLFRAVSVDPDTGGADDGQGAPPLEIERAFILRITSALFKDGFESVKTANPTR